MTTINNIIQAQKLLESYISHQNTSDREDLAKMQGLMNFLGNPQNDLKIIHIAGTSGKTSTAYYVSALLNAAGFSTGLTVSPHIDKPSERAQINLKNLNDDEYCEKLSQFIGIIEKYPVKPSYFELLIAFAFWIFKQYNIQYAVVEVGVGGLIDSTNVINRTDKICVITDIGIDHVKKLGYTIAEIAHQKAGIITSKNNVFMNSQQPLVVDIVSSQCIEKDADLTITDHIKSDAIESIKIPSFQKRNLRLAVEAVNFLIDRDYSIKLSEQNIITASETHIPARMELIKIKNKSFIIDGSHNEQKIETLVESIQKLYPNRSIKILLGVGISEKYHLLEKIKSLNKISNAIILTSFNRGDSTATISIKPHELGDAAKIAGFNNISIEENTAKALDLLIKNTDDIGLIIGSFLLAAQVRPLVLGKAE